MPEELSSTDASPVHRGPLAHRTVLPVVAVGGMLGAAARHGLELAWPAASGQFPWATFATNLGGCALIGLLMVYVEIGAPHPLLRPFLGVGVLGGFTTFSTYAVQTTRLVTASEPALAIGYLFGTVVAALVAVALGTVLGRLLLSVRR